VSIFAMRVEGTGDREYMRWARKAHQAAKQLFSQTVNRWQRNCVGGDYDAFCSTTLLSAGPLRLSPDSFASLGSRATWVNLQYKLRWPELECNERPRPFGARGLSSGPGPLVERRPGDMRPEAHGFCPGAIEKINEKQ
jgi:hypothetical protein